MHFTTGGYQIMKAARGGKCIRSSEEDIRPMGRDTAGVKAMTLSGEGDCLVDMLVIDPQKDVLTVASNGYGKRSRLDDYRIQSRAGKGIKAGVFNELTGELVNLKQVSDDDDIMMISVGGTIIRMHCSDSSTISRAARGVRLMRLRDGQVATVAVTERDDESEVQTHEEQASDLSVEELSPSDEED